VKVLFDTSVLLASIIQEHPMHERAMPWLQRAKARRLDFLVSAHSLAELYAVLSMLPTSPRVHPRTAWQLVHENVEKSARVVSLSATDYGTVIRELAERGLTGGVVYDAVIARAAQKAQADRLLTLNPRDFQRVGPDAAGLIISP